MSDRRHSSQPASRFARAAMLLTLVCGLGGCAGGAAVTASVGPAVGGTTVAFDSIDGPPPQVFDRMVSMIDTESKLRNVSVVSREAGAAYRVRSYLSAQVRGGRTIIAWVWDVYDRNQQRALRLSGEELTGRPGRDAWAQADDVVLRRIAQAGFTGLSGLVNGGLPAEPAPAAPALRGPAMASAADPAPTPLGFAAR